MAETLAGMFREKVSKMKDYKMKAEAEFDIAYSTGFLSFDFLNGSVVHVKNETMDFKYNSIGIPEGSLCTFIGRSSSGKSTLINQMAANIIRPFPNAVIYEDMAEATGMNHARLETITGFTPEEINTKYIIRDRGITAENFYERIKMIHDMKMGARENFEYDTGMYDPTGNRIFKLEPTVYILDSLALLMPETYTEEDELSGNMAATATARVIAGIFRRICGMLKGANIILLVINHINQKVQTGFFPTKADLSYLKQDETIPCGRTPLYLSTLICRLDDHSKLKDSEGFNIAGTMVDLTVVKSRTSASGRKVTLVYTFDHGFDQNLSLYQLLKENGRIGGAGAFLYIGEHNDIKFAQKNFLEKLAENETLQQYFMEEVLAVLQTLITDGTIDEVEEQSKVDITSQLLGQLIPLVA